MILANCQQIRYNFREKGQNVNDFSDDAEGIAVISSLREQEGMTCMMYPFMTLNDDTEITHSEMKENGQVKVYIETPDEKDGFHQAVCWLPEYRWESISGYTEEEMAYFRQLVRNNAHLIIEFSRDGGVLNATTA